MLRLECPIQHYQWGDREAIADFLGVEPTNEPDAELWMGAHRSAPSLVNGTSLADLIAADTEGLLGSEIANSFGELPFLVKILAAAEPLSIQTHPTASQAQAGFEKENEAGIPLDSPSRLYSDPNHKPELVCALSVFHAKCGFRDLAKTRELFDALGDDRLAGLRDKLAVGGTPAEVLKQTLSWLFHLPAEDVIRLTAAAVESSSERSWQGWWFEPDLAWVSEMHHKYPGDVGVIVALLLNHVRLEPGEALFLGAGNLHAYLRGVAVEIMANSNNVIRGGLTPKHVDVGELLAVVDCTPIEVPVQTSSRGSHQFDAPVADFGLIRVEVDETQSAVANGPEIIFVTEGTLVITSTGDEPFGIERGQVAFRSAAEGPYEVSGRGVLWRATAGRGG